MSDFAQYRRDAMHSTGLAALLATLGRLLVFTSPKRDIANGMSDRALADIGLPRWLQFDASEDVEAAWSSSHA